MEDNSYFERLCRDVYGYYGMLRNVDPMKHALVMLRSLGEFWTENELNEFISKLSDGQEFLSFTDFRRLAKSKWCDELNNQNENKEVNKDEYGNVLYMKEKDIKKFEEAFSRVSEFYTGNKGPNNSLSTEVLLNILNNFEDPMPERVADYLVSSIHVYNNAVTSRALLCMIGRREKIQNI